MNSLPRCEHGDPLPVHEARREEATLGHLSAVKTGLRGFTDPSWRQQKGRGKGKGAGRGSDRRWWARPALTLQGSVVGVWLAINTSLVTMSTDRASLTAGWASKRPIYTLAMYSVGSQESWRGRQGGDPRRGVPTVPAGCGSGPHRPPHLTAHHISEVNEQPLRLRVRLPFALVAGRGQTVREALVAPRWIQPPQTQLPPPAQGDSRAPSPSRAEKPWWVLAAAPGTRCSMTSLFHHASVPCDITASP